VHASLAASLPSSSHIPAAALAAVTIPSPPRSFAYILPSREEHPLSDFTPDFSTPSTPGAGSHPDPPPAEPTPPAAPAPSALHRIFIGKDGLRAGWSILLFVILCLALFRAVAFLAHKVHLLPPAPRRGAALPTPGPTLTIISETLPFLVAIFVSWIMSKLERRPISVYGLGGQRRLPLFLTGLGWGVVSLSLLILILWKTGLLVFDGRLLFGTDILRYGAAWLLGFLAVALVEEYLTRGYLQYTLTRGLAGFYRWAFKTRHSVVFGFWTAALFFSILFGLGHHANPDESPIGLLSAGLVGLVFCLSLWRTGSLWWAIGFHTSWDWAQSFLYGVPDSGTMIKFHFLASHPVGKPLLSGGVTGPEGSIFILPMLLLLVVIILFTLPRSPYGYLQPQPALENSGLENLRIENAG
jgi:membrane protease YdiL (CAAX protease family)